MRFPQTKTAILLLAGALAIAPVALLASGAQLSAAAGMISFWLTVGLAVTGSVLSAFCIYNPVSKPKREPYSFVGQWFIWLDTPLLWGVVAASLVLPWLKPFELIAIFVAAGVSGRAAQTICNWMWRERGAIRAPDVAYLAPPQRRS